MTTGEVRRDEIRQIQKKHPWFYTLIIVAIALGIGVGIAASEFADDSRGFWMNLVTEALGVIASISITVFVIDRIYEHRNRNRLRRRLLREVRMPSNDIVLNAIGQMWDEGWLTGDNGLLKGEDLSGANLQNADLRGANLNRANLTRAKLQETKLQGADLREAQLFQANLCDAKLNGAILTSANMEHAVLEAANFENADMTMAQLRGAKLDAAFFWQTKMAGVNMENVDLRNVLSLKRANLEDADMPFIDLRGKDLQNSNLAGATLFGASLQDTRLIGVNLENANLKGAYMRGALVVTRRKIEVIEQDNAPIAYAITDPTLLTNTTLPDGTQQAAYSSNEEIERFTDPQNPEFHGTLEAITTIRQAAGLTD